MPVGRSIFHDEVLTFDVAEVAQSLPQGRHVRRVLTLWGRLQHANPVHLPGWLCFAYERRDEQAEGDRGDKGPAADH